jgi:hypothetical protein
MIFSKDVLEDITAWARAHGVDPDAIVAFDKANPAPKRKEGFSYRTLTVPDLELGPMVLYEKVPTRPAPPTPEQGPEEQAPRPPTLAGAKSPAAPRGAPPSFSLIANAPPTQPPPAPPPSSPSAKPTPKLAPTEAPAGVPGPPKAAPRAKPTKPSPAKPAKAGPKPLPPKPKGKPHRSSGFGKLRRKRDE